MLSEKDFMKGIGYLMAAYPDFPCTPETISVYRMNLSDFHPKDFEKAVLAHIRHNKWFPKISELRSELVRLKGFRRPSALDVWHELQQAAERKVKGGDPGLDENTTLALRVCGGWERYSQLTYREMDFRFKDFERSYNDGMAREDRLLQLGHDLARPQIEEKRLLE